MPRLYDCKKKGRKLSMERWRNEWGWNSQPGVLCTHSNTNTHTPTHTHTHPHTHTHTHIHTHTRTHTRTHIDIERINISGFSWHVYRSKIVDKPKNHVIYIPFAFFMCVLITKEVVCKKMFCFHEEIHFKGHHILGQG